MSTNFHSLWYVMLALNEQFWRQHDIDTNSPRYDPWSDVGMIIALDERIRILFFLLASPFCCGRCGIGSWRDHFPCFQVFFKSDRYIFSILSLLKNVDISILSALVLEKSWNIVCVIVNKIKHAQWATKGCFKCPNKITSYWNVTRWISIMKYII